MRTKGIFICGFIVFLVASKASTQEILKSTLDDQKTVEVTAYNNNLALIKDTREIPLPKGEGELRFMDVAAHIMPVTVRIQSLNAPDQFAVLEQNYEYDLMSANKLLDKYVGKTINVIDHNRYQDKKEILEATLLSNNEGQIYKIGEKIYLGHPGLRVLPEIPEDLIAKPTLTWLYQNDSRQAQEIEVSYLTKNINWKADYVVAINDQDTAAGINGWVTLDNKSGATYRDASLKLVAGEVHLAKPEIWEGRDKVYEAGVAFKIGRPQFEEKSFFEYHIYDLQRPTTIKDKQTKQVSLLEAEDVLVEKELMVRGVNHYFTGQYRQSDVKIPVEVYIKFENSRKNHMGLALPAGVMRLYKQDHEGSLQFIGEDRIQHTPKNEEVKLKIGEAFDVVVERVQTDYKVYKSYPYRVHESEWKITIRNHKDQNVTVHVIEPMPAANWNIINASAPYEKMDAFTIKFSIPVEADGETQLQYRVKVHHG